jgi:hypothetical protein
MPLKELDAVPELRDDPSLKDFNDVATLAKSYKETKAFVGSSIRPPGPDASPEARKEFYEKLVKHAPDLVPLRDGDAEAEKVVWGKLGRPSKREEYEFKTPDGVDINVEALRDAAEAAGMTKAQFTKLAEKAVAGAQAQAGAFQKGARGAQDRVGCGLRYQAEERGSGGAEVGPVRGGSRRHHGWPAVVGDAEDLGRHRDRGGQRGRSAPKQRRWRRGCAHAGRGGSAVQRSPGPPGVLQSEPPGARDLRAEGHESDEAVASGVGFRYKKSFGVLLGRRRGRATAPEGAATLSGRRPLFCSSLDRVGPRQLGSWTLGDNRKAPKYTSRAGDF